MIVEPKVTNESTSNMIMEPLSSPQEFYDAVEVHEEIDAVKVLDANDYRVGFGDSGSDREDTGSVVDHDAEILKELESLLRLEVETGTAEGSEDHHLLLPPAEIRVP
jgi:hypothetical protein